MRVLRHIVTHYPAGIGDIESGGRAAVRID
jgi:hypothetical protein